MKISLVGLRTIIRSVLRENDRKSVRNCPNCQGPVLKPVKFDGHCSAKCQNQGLIKSLEALEKNPNMTAREVYDLFGWTGVDGTRINTGSMVSRLHNLVRAGVVLKNRQSSIKPNSHSTSLSVLFSVSPDWRERISSVLRESHDPDPARIS